MSSLVPYWYRQALPNTVQGRPTLAQSKYSALPFNRFLTPTMYNDLIYGGKQALTELPLQWPTLSPKLGVWQLAPLHNHITHCLALGQVPVFKVPPLLLKKGAKLSKHAKTQLMGYCLSYIIAGCRNYPVVWDLTAVLKANPNIHPTSGPYYKLSHYIPTWVKQAPLAHFVLPSKSPWHNSPLQT
jgi:hypothetical protein